MQEENDNQKHQETERLIRRRISRLPRVRRISRRGDSGGSAAAEEQAPPRRRLRRSPAAEEQAAEEPAAPEPAAEAEPAAEPAEQLSPKQRRKQARSRASGPAGPERSPEDRSRERAEERARKAAARSRWRAKRREKRAREPKRAGRRDCAEGWCCRVPQAQDAPGRGGVQQGRQDDHGAHRCGEAPSRLREGHTRDQHAARPRRDEPGRRGRHRARDGVPPAVAHEALAAGRGPGEGPITHDPGRDTPSGRRQHRCAGAALHSRARRIEAPLCRRRRRDRRHGQERRSTGIGAQGRSGAGGRGPHPPPVRPQGRHIHRLRRERRRADRQREQPARNSHLRPGRP